MAIDILVYNVFSFSSGVLSGWRDCVLELVYKPKIKVEDIYVNITNIILQKRPLTTSRKGFLIIKNELKC